MIHETVPVRVWVDVDKGIAAAVRRLNEIPGVRTLASCQGTIGEGGAEPYRAQVMIEWDCQETIEKVAAEFDLTHLRNYLAYAHPRSPSEKSA